VAGNVFLAMTAALPQLYDPTFRSKDKLSSTKRTKTRLFISQGMYQDFGSVDFSHVRDLSPFSCRFPSPL
jgi:hypothetical protein